MKAFIFKIGAFLFFCLAFWKWGEASAKKTIAEGKASEAIKNSKNYEKINSADFIDNPASRLCKKTDKQLP